jgi:NADH-quinone oxidoreductase subunit N
LLNYVLVKELSILFFFFGINIISYVVNLLVLFTILIFNDSSKIISTSNLFIINNNKLFKIAFIIAILSLSGIPPFIGFFAKFYVYNYFLYKTNYFLLFLFFFFNLFALYFYLQNTRYLLFNNKVQYYKCVLNTVIFSYSNFILFLIPLFSILFCFFYLEYLYIILYIML